MAAYQGSPVEPVHGSTAPGASSSAELNDPARVPEQRGSKCIRTLRGRQHRLAESGRDHPGRRRATGDTSFKSAFP